MECLLLDLKHAALGVIWPFQLVCCIEVEEQIEIGIFYQICVQEAFATRNYVIRLRLPIYINGEDSSDDVGQQLTGSST